MKQIKIIGIIFLSVGFSACAEVALDLPDTNTSGTSITVPVSVLDSAFGAADLATSRSGSHVAVGGMTTMSMSGTAKSGKHILQDTMMVQGRDRLGVK